MQVKNLEKAASRATIIAEITKADLEPSIQKVYLKARKDIALPGFRKGKAPRAMIETVYGKHVFFEDALDELFPEIYTQCVLSQDIKAVGRPMVTNMEIAEGDSVILTIVTDLYPEVTLGQYKGLEVIKAEATVDASEVDAEIQRMANNAASVSTVDRAAELGDTAVIDYEGFKDGVPFNGGKAENYELKLGSGSFIPGFEEQVVGMTAGEEKDINVTFPEEYHAAELAGAPVIFKIKLHEVKVTNVPAIDDEFVKDVSEFDTVDELRADIEKNILTNKQEGIQRAFENAAIEMAVANMTAEIPDSMVDEELEREMERMDYELRSQGASLEAYAQMLGGDMEAIKKSLRPGALNAVKINVMLDAIASAENIEVTEEEINEEYNNMAQRYGMDVEKIKTYFKAEELKGDMQMRKAAKLVAESAVVAAPKTEE